MGEALVKASVAAGVRGVILGTKHGLSASVGGYAGLWLSRTVSMESITSLPGLTVAAVAALVSVVLFELLVRPFDRSSDG